MTGMAIDWGSLGLVASVTVLGTAFILTICSLAARMLATVHAKHEAGEVEGVRLAQVLAGVFIAIAAVIAGTMPLSAASSRTAEASFSMAAL